ncbi:hypothetical protein ACFC6U_35845, partial [Kitasatospora purpeofusca]|uniref:hypothetical protein n=1 Tax=Kitasatospora purpeofusca TaxID=67352 RepID=UPI0035E21A41
LTSSRGSGPVVPTDIANLLANRLPTTARSRLVLPARPGTTDGFEAAYVAARRTLHDIEAVMEPSPPRLYPGVASGRTTTPPSSARGSRATGPQDLTDTGH